VSNRPTIEHNLTPAETSYLMDLLHGDWNRQVMGYAAVFDGANRPYDDHVLQWRKSRASRLLNKLDENAYVQGFWEDGHGL
jgi:hypothetical protein